MLRTRHQLFFSGPRTPEGIRNLLRMNGFVHVTGLKVTTRSGDDEYVIGEHPHFKCGHWDRNNGKLAVVTKEGEVWIRSTVSPEREGKLETAPLQGLIQMAAPNGQGAFVPLSNGEEVDFHLFLARIADPDYGIEYEQEPVIG